MGTRKLREEIGKELGPWGRGFGRDKFFDLLRRKDLLVKRKRKYAYTTNSDHPFYKYGNELQKTPITGTDQAWVSDITYVPTRQGFAYLSLVTDVYSRMIVGWNLSRSLSVEGALNAVQQAIAQRRCGGRLVHHSDRGIQYCCHAYTGLLKARGITISMGQAGNCYDNAIAERINGILKDEYLLDSEFVNFDHALSATKQAVYLYNYKRPHWSLNLKKPAEVHQTQYRHERKKITGLKEGMPAPPLSKTSPLLKPTT